MTSISITKTCSLIDCNKPVRARTLCGTHYKQMYKAGRINEFEGRNAFIITPTDFWKYVAITANDNRCWEWQRGGHDFGYGTVTIQGRKWFTHRYAFFLANGYEPLSSVLHECDNPPCCNPKHLREGTQAENIQDAVARGRMIKGERCHNATISDATALIIKQQLQIPGILGKNIARDLNIPIGTVSNIKLGKTFKHVQLE